MFWEDIDVAFSVMAQRVEPNHTETESFEKKRKLNNKVTIYEDSMTQACLEGIVNEYQDLWKKQVNIVDIPPSKWMAIPLIPNVKAPNTKVYPFLSCDWEVMNKKFNQLHTEGKLEWITEAIKFGFSVFVTWKTVQTDKEDVQKG